MEGKDTIIDTIEVRADERFDTAKVADYLRGKLPGSELPLTVRQFGGGAANLTYKLEYSAQSGDDQRYEYVLRRPPLGPVAKSAHDMGREYRVLAVLNDAFPEAPRAYHYCEDPEVIGADFFVMERRYGVVVRTQVPALYAQMKDAPQRMSTALVDTLAAFHAVDYEAIGLAKLGRPNGFVERQIEGWAKRWQGAKHEELPLMDELYQWLIKHQPPVGSGSLVHNDYKLDNVMLASEDPGKLVAVFDWDMCTLGDPLCDLGALLCYWSEPSDPDFYKRASMMPVDDPRFMTRSQLIERYAQKSGRDVSHIHFYHALGLYRLVVIIAQIYIRYVRGQTKDERFASFGERIPLLAQAAHEITRQT
ncbi:MAG: phosphotransferase family protein [Chloroflexota bacterium]